MTISSAATAHLVRIVVMVPPPWRRWTGIEPAGVGSPRPPALKAGEPTRYPDTSVPEVTWSLARSGSLVLVIVVVEGPSAAGKTTWCRMHARRWLPEPGALPMDENLHYQIDRWREAVACDARGELVVLDGDPFKLYYSWASWKVGHISESSWREHAEEARCRFVEG